MACCIGGCKRRATILSLALLGLIAALGVVAPQAEASEKLPALGAPIGATSVSGLSSGAYMAGQIQLAHAKDIVGAGLVAGGPFACAESAAGRLVPYWPTAVVQNAQKALHGCMLVDWGTPDPVALADRAKELASSGAIDSLDRSRRGQDLSLLGQRGPHGDAAGRRGRQGALPRAWSAG